jgi:2-haloacid dehalogenase
MSKVIVFDVNETLLDLRALDPHFKRVFGSPIARQLWFSQMLQLAMTATLTDNYHDFATVGRAALQMTAARLRVGLTGDDERAIMGTMLQLPPHLDVKAGLERLKNAGLRLAALTNSAPDALTAQLTNAGLVDYFDRMLSVDAARQFKPAKAVYEMAAEKLGVTTAEMRMVAAHDWDVAGAMKAGCAGAFVARPGMVLSPLMDIPDIIGTDLVDVADQILATIS